MNALKLDDDGAEPLLEQMAGRLPAILALGRSPDGAGHAKLASGWFVEDDGLLLVVTAAHFWAEVIALEKAGLDAQVRLVDQESLGVNTVYLGAASGLTTLDRLHPEHGLDLTMLALSPLHERTVRAHENFHPFTRESIAVDLKQLNEPGPWLSIADVDDELAEEARVFVLGYPSTSVEVESDGLTLSPMALKVLGQRPWEKLGTNVAKTGEYPIRPDWLYLEVEGTDQLPEGFGLQGMSGGPVVLQTHERIVVVGTQTLWWPELAVVGVQPVHLVARELDAIRRVRANET